MVFAEELVCNVEPWNSYAYGHNAFFNGVLEKPYVQKKLYFKYYKWTAIIQCQVHIATQQIDIKIMCNKN